MRWTLILTFASEIPLIRRYFLVGEIAAGYKGQNVDIFRVQLRHGLEKPLGVLADKGGSGVSARSCSSSSNGTVIFRRRALSTSKIATDGKEQSDTEFVCVVAFKISCKAFLHGIGGQVIVAGSAKKIAEELILVVLVKLPEDVHYSSPLS